MIPGKVACNCWMGRKRRSWSWMWFLFQKCPLKMDVSIGYLSHGGTPKSSKLVNLQMLLGRYLHTVLVYLPWGNHTKAAWWFQTFFIFHHIGNYPSKLTNIVVWNMEFYDFPLILGMELSSKLTFASFFRGVGLNHQRY